MPVIAKLHYLRIAPRKVRLVADIIRDKTVEEAQTILSFITKKAAPVILKLLKQAVSNAKTSFHLEEKNLYISKILVDEGPKYKRWMPRARGQASPIQKKTSHITIVLDEAPKGRALNVLGARPTGQVIKKPKRVKKFKKVEKVEKIKEIEKAPKVEKPRLRPEVEPPKPKIEKGLRRIFRRKAF